MAITEAVQERVDRLIREKLAEFWQITPPERVPLESPDGVVDMATQACEWIAYELDELGTVLAGKNESFVTFFTETPANGMERGWYYRKTGSLNNEPIGPFPTEVSAVTAMSRN